jgi:general secretion pathway protein D
MEGNGNKDFNIGTRWSAAGKASSGGKNAIYGAGSATNLPVTDDNGNPVLPSGFSLGLFGENIAIGTGAGTITFPSISAMVNVYKQDKDVNILSTPQILTTDNEEATIIVGQNVPFQTRSAAESASETYSSFEYRDVAITLKITPQISQDRLVRLNISQELTKLTEAAETVDFKPTTLKRTIETTVIVEDGHTVVIGGLIDDSSTITEQKVPLLGDIPLLGWLFKYKSKAFDKTNLYVFLTPRVIQHPAEASELYEQKKNEMDTIREGSIKMYIPKEPELPKEPDEKGNR